MVTDNGHWSYCIVILRRKGRKRWCRRDTVTGTGGAGMSSSGSAAILASSALSADHEAATTTTAGTMRSRCENGEKLFSRDRGGFFVGASWSWGRPSVGRDPNPNRQRPHRAGGRFAPLCDFWCRVAGGKLHLPSVECLRWLLIVFLYLNFLSSNAVSAAVDVGSSLRVLRQTSNANSGNREICSSLDIRNSVQSFNQLTNCRVIEGFLQIVLMDRTNESDFVNLSFPKLREITGYLLLYRVNGLTTLANLFPNLSVIRGHDLFMNYALVVYEMLHLQELGLYSLTDIPRGYVFITKNPLLCYIDTIDWARIVANGKDTNFIFDNRQSNACPKCPSLPDPLCGYNNQTKQLNCWNSQHCQKTCPRCSHNRCTDKGECCHDYCLGGCSGNDSDHCFACKKVFLESTNRCVSKCPDGYYMFKDRRCLTERECHDMPRPKEETGLHIRGKPYKAFNGTCIIECPVGYQETSYADNSLKLFRCEECSGTCRKICDAASVDSIQSAQRLKGCVVINGSLEIQMRGGGNIVKELEDSLSMIEEITGYLKIVRSLSLVSLNFLRRLKLIKGESLENGKYVLVVLDNQNLAELWDFSRRENSLKIINGRIFFHFNPKLCLDKIRELQKILSITEVTDLEVAPTSNGDKVACNITTLHVSVSRLTHEHCLITWIPYNHYEMRTLLGYVVYYMEVPPNVNVSMNDGRDACGGDGWKSADVEVPDAAGNSNVSRDNITHPITHLKPYTRYAYYVRTYTIAMETNGAQSKIQYFTTNPSTPTPPRQLKIKSVTSSEIVIQWQPPEQPNGQLEKYVIHVEPTYSSSISGQRNYCKEPVDNDKDAKEDLKKQQYLKQTVEKKSDECSCQLTENLPKIKKNDQDVQALIEFENKLHDNIYVKSSHPTRTRRSIYSQNVDNDPSHKSSEKELTFLSSSEAPSISSNASMPYKNISVSLKNSSNPYTVETNATTNEWKIPNLTHFTDYTINIQACRMKLESAPLPSACSTEKMETVQTSPLENADKIDEKSVEVEVLNDTNYVKLKWAEPQITNGPILTYVIQYRKIDVENQQAQIQCIPKYDLPVLEWPLTSLPPGNYSVSIKATTLAKESNHFTEPRYFYIKEIEPPAIRQLLLGALCAVLIIVVVLILILVGVRYFYPDSWHHRKFLFATVNPEYFKPIEGYDKWEISRRKIVFDNLLGIGHFGEVYEGRAKGIIQKGVTTKVAIKTLNKSPTNSRTWSSFLNEASVMKQFDTHHVVRLLGVVTKGEPLVIMELMAKGDLRTYLRSCRADVPEEERKGPLQPPPTLQEILRMAAEISDGMLYLSDKKFVHRDLAARNCMINAEGTVKIGDFGLTRDVYETDYYRKDSKGHLPVRWMAPESLRDGIFTSRSDVWSYGVVLWEMATLASLPYTGLANGEVMPYVQNGGVMEEPENCPPILTFIMKQCWQFKYIERPTFSDILETLLPFVDDGFSEVSYYHTEEAIQLRASNAEAVAEEDTPYTPLGIRGDFEDFSLDSDDDNEEEEVVDDNGDEEEEEVAAVVAEEKEELKEQNHLQRALQYPRAASNDGLANTSTGGDGVAISGNASVRSLPTVNGYIRRPHNLIPLVSTKTTPC